MAADTTEHKSSETVRRSSTARRTEPLRPAQDIMNYVREYARQKPDVAAFWCFGLGIVVGWKIKPW